jgi:streptogramin lyase
VIAEHPISISTLYPSGITVGADGALWFIDSEGAYIGRRAL